MLRCPRGGYRSCALRVTARPAGEVCVSTGLVYDGSTVLATALLGETFGANDARRAAGGFAGALDPHDVDVPTDRDIVAELP